jgi:hypothetical protein
VSEHDEPLQGDARAADVRITWWSRGTRAKEMDALMIKGDKVTLVLHDEEKVTVEWRS